ncbi:TonB-dependent receptor [Sulfidibacter corallicola]|uniref:TonB-dependent receptor n=1 Tax=Sulfidibacter corallicola TaxID=2818388 RepID=A0A8A4TJX9_SULCO|nr:TonB-dependent receptor [Sulfidibacter corallicola]QTD49850.1 TonB-dependent receptor [Sulfidibacter corallicola]
MRTVPARRSIVISLFLCWMALSTTAGDAPEGAADTPPAPATEAEAAGTESPAPMVDDYLRVVEENRTLVPKTNTAGTRLPLTVQRTPASVVVVPEKVNDEQTNLVLGDVLHNVSGVQSHTNFGVHDYFMVRGFESLTASTVLTDLAPEPEATFYHMYNLERVEVIKGPGAFSYGANPLAGTVNLVRKQPLFDRFTQLEATGGSFGLGQLALDANGTATHRGLAFRINGLWREADGYRDDKDQEVRAFNPSIRWQIGAHHEVVFNAEIARAEYTPDAGLPFLQGAPADVDPETSYALPTDLSEQDVTRLRVDYQYRAPAGWVLRNRTYFNELDWQSAGTIYTAVAPGPTGSLNLLRLQTHLDDHQKFSGNQLEFSWSRQGAVDQVFLVGLELRRETDVFDLRQFGAQPSANFPVPFMPIDLLQPQEFYTAAPTYPVGGPTLSDSTRETLALYAVDHLRFGSRWDLIIGARFDRVDYEADISLDLGGLQVPARIDRRDEEVSPFLGLVFAPNERLSFYMNAATAFAPPSTLALDQAEPEESEQNEFGAKLSLLDGRLSASTAIYQLERQNILIPDETGVTGQNGDQRSRGLEMDLIASLDGGWSLLANFAFIDAELTRLSQLDAFGIWEDLSGNEPAFVPERSAGLWLAKAFDNGWLLNGGVRHVGDRYVSVLNRDVADAFTLFDAGIGYRHKQWQAMVNFKNLGDEFYLTRGTNTPLVSAAIPGNGFETRARLGVKF